MPRLNLKSVFFVVIVCIAAALTPRSDVHADGLEIAFFNIEHDEETNALHIVHRFFQQDIEIALSGVAGKSILLVDNIATKQAVQPYIEERFSLSALDGTPLETRWVNVEQRDGTLLIRQQSHLPASASGLVAASASLLKKLSLISCSLMPIPLRTAANISSASSGRGVPSANASKLPSAAA